MANLIDRDRLLAEIDKTFHETDVDDARQGGILLCRNIIRTQPEYINGVGRTAMISQPMRGRTNEEIEYSRRNAIEWLRSHGFYVKNTFFRPEEQPVSPKEAPLYYLALSIDAMSKCDTVYFCRGWEDARGCKIEHAVAQAYGLQILYEGDEVKENTDG